MNIARAQTWKKRSLSVQERECDRIYTDAIVDEILSQIPLTNSYGCENNRQLLRSMMFDLEGELIRLTRPIAHSKCGALEGLKDKLKEMCQAFDGIDDDSAKVLLEHFRINLVRILRRRRSWRTRPV